MSFKLTSSAKSPKTVTPEAIISASKNVHKTGTPKAQPAPATAEKPKDQGAQNVPPVSPPKPAPKKVEKPKRDPSRCLICGSNAPTENGLYFDNDCKVVYEHRVCSKCGYAFTVRRPMTDEELTRSR